MFIRENILAAILVSVNDLSVKVSVTEMSVSVNLICETICLGYFVSVTDISVSLQGLSVTDISQSVIFIGEFICHR